MKNYIIYNTALKKEKFHNNLLTDQLFYNVLVFIFGTGFIIYLGIFIINALSSTVIYPFALVFDLFKVGFCAIGLAYAEIKLSTTKMFLQLEQQLNGDKK